jgi:hypothetical protein
MIIKILEVFIRSGYLKTQSRTRTIDQIMDANPIRA